MTNKEKTILETKLAFDDLLTTLKHISGNDLQEFIDIISAIKSKTIDILLKNL